MARVEGLKVGTLHKGCPDNGVLRFHRFRVVRSSTGAIGDPIYEYTYIGELVCDGCCGLFANADYGLQFREYCIGVFTDFKTPKKRPNECSRCKEGSDLREIGLFVSDKNAPMGRAVLTTCVLCMRCGQPVWIGFKMNPRRR